MFHDEDEMALVLLQQANQHEIHMLQLLSKVSSMEVEERRIKEVLPNNFSYKKEEPGRENTQERNAKDKYCSRGPTSVHKLIRNQNPDLGLFEKTMHLSREKFDFSSRLGYCGSKKAFGCPLNFSKYYSVSSRSS